MSHIEVTAPLPGIEDADGRLRIYDHGAHVAAWRPAASGDPVLWVSSETAYADGKAIRGGIPICFPWFGPGARGDKTPAHGFVRTTAWRRENVRDDHGVLQVEYRIDPSITGEQPQFPFPYLASYVVRSEADTLELSLTVKNTGDEAFTIEEALHTYLAVGDVRRVRVRGLDGATYLDKNTDEPLFDNVQDGVLRLSGPTDRVYLHDGAVIVEDPELDRRLELVSDGAANVVVWNPWDSGAAGMADVGDDEWPSFICVEAANAFADARTVLPGETWRMSQRIGVAPLAEED